MLVILYEFIYFNNNNLLMFYLPLKIFIGTTQENKSFYVPITAYNIFLLTKLGWVFDRHMHSLLLTAPSTDTRVEAHARTVPRKFGSLEAY